MEALQTNWTLGPDFVALKWLGHARVGAFLPDGAGGRGGILLFGRGFTGGGFSHPKRGSFFTPKGAMRGGGVLLRVWYPDPPQGDLFLPGWEGRGVFSTSGIWTPHLLNDCSSLSPNHECACLGPNGLDTTGMHTDCKQWRKTTLKGFSLGYPPTFLRSL